MSKIHANFGVKRNKKPLQNLVYKIEVMTEEEMWLDFRESDEVFEERFSEYKFSEGTYAVLKYQYEKNLNERPNIWNSKGFITEKDLRIKLEGNNWSRFRQGQRIFTIQRRKDGKNL
jgi:hypothetical protein